MSAVLTETMTARERWVAALDLKPVDRLPFWPKIGGSFSADALIAPVRVMHKQGADRARASGLGVTQVVWLVRVCGPPPQPPHSSALWPQSPRAHPPETVHGQAPP